MNTLRTFQIHTRW